MSEATYEAVMRIVANACIFCESTEAEMQELEGTQSNSAPAEFMLLHESVNRWKEMTGRGKHAGSAVNPRST